MKSRLIFSALLFLLHCSTFSRNRDSYFENYHDKSFACLNSYGTKDLNKFLLYKAIYSKLVKDYREENERFKTAKNVIIGNSLVMAFPPEKVKEHFSEYQVVLRGIGGDMTDMLLERLEENALNLKPRALFVEIGGNDLINGKCLSYIENNLKKIIQLVRDKSPGTELVFIGVPPTANSELNSIVPLYNFLLKSMSEDGNKFRFIDLWKDMRDKDRPFVKEEFLRPKDKIHFNEKGYDLWGVLLKPFLKK